MGGDYYLKTPGFYKPCGNSKAGICETYDALQFINQDKAYPCGEGWDWIYKQLRVEFRVDESDGFKEIERSLGTAHAEVKKKQAVRSFLKAETLIDKEEGNHWGILAALKSVVSWIIGIIGAGATWLLKTITTYLITLILPLVQALLLFVIVVVLPILLPFSGFKPAFLFSIFASMFAIQFVSVIIAVISIIDNALLSIYAANSGSDNAFMQAVHIAGSGKGLEFFLINLLILIFYLIAIKIWFGFMMQFGGEATKHISQSMDGVKDIGITGSGISNITKGAGKLKEWLS